MDKQILEQKRLDLEKVYIPQYETLYLHPEEGEDFRINKAFSQIESDMIRIDDYNKELANSTDELLRETVDRLNAAKYKIMAEKERLQDITMLCNKYTDFDNVVILKTDDFNNVASGSDMLTGEVTSVVKANAVISDIQGNGYEGNTYVYNDYEYQSDTMFTGDRSALTDNSVATYYEYSRITADPKEEELLHDFNYDSEEARCTININAGEKINEIDIVSESDGNKVIGLQYSNDGKDYYHIQIPKISVNKKDDSYDNFGYIYGSGKLSLPNCKYAKITLESSKTTNDVLAYEKKVSKEGETSVYVDTNIIKTAKRHVIKINDLNVYAKRYAASSVYRSRDIIVDKAYAIAFFCNVYIPDGLNESSVEFVLTVNGIDYTVQPINSNFNGIKVIRFSQGKFNSKYTKYIGEVIKSAYVTVKIKSKSNLSPYINNMKILVGGEL